MKLPQIFKSGSEDLEFIDDSSIVYPHYPIVAAKDVKPFFKEEQEKKFNSYNFIGCPGLHDYSRLGYIVTAWSDFHIKANKAGHIAVVGSVGENASKRGTPIQQPRPMATDITHGLFQMEDVSPHVWIFPSPWKVQGSYNLSALILPAVFHSNFLDDLYVYPGVVDYQGFNTLNFIISPKRKCEVTIPAGTPILHVIPFYTNKNMVATYGPGKREQHDAARILKWYHETNFYRKYYMIKKKFSITKKIPE